ncbi:MAG: hypothetical protein JNN04_14400 [Cyclobacteriaceae bacterium]|nr:hypothetical protein [Cyclobacteriaceae bacterium]
MMIKLITLFTVIVSASYGQTKTFKDIVRGFEFTYPDDWILDTLTSNPMVLAPKEDTPPKYPATFQVLTEESQETLDKVFKTYVTDWYPHQVDNFKIIAQGNRTINDYTFKWIECEYKKANITYSNIIYVTVGNRRLYLMEGHTSTKKYPTFKSKFFSMINSFRLI